METSGVGVARRKSKSRHLRSGLIAAGMVAVLALSALALYRLLPEAGMSGTAEPAGQEGKSLPSVLVLPFANMSGDPEQEYFVDGITEDIITDLSSLSGLMVIARNTTFSYKGQRVQPTEVGRDLGVRYVLDGSVRKSGDRIRINTQLVDVSSGTNVWAERYDRKLVEVFALQEDVTRKLVSALALNLTAGEKQQLAKVETGSLEAYQLFLIGQQQFRLRSKAGYEQAVQAYQKALELDPAYARAYGALAVVLSHMARDGWVAEPDEAKKTALEHARKAVSLDPTSPEVYWSLGYVYMWQEQFPEATDAIEKAIELSPSYADGYGLLAFISNWRGRAEDARRYILKAMELNPHYTFDYPWNLGLANYTLGRYQEAADALNKALERNESSLLPRLYLAACYVRLDRAEDAAWEIERARVVRPEVSISYLTQFLPYEDDALKNALFDDLRKAGLPE
jgi:adenylate cyclase